MTLADLIQRFRELARDLEAPYSWSDALLTSFLNEAQEQAAIRGRLLIEDANPAVCEIALQPGVHTYPLHPSLFELVRVRAVMASDPGRVIHLPLKSREWLDAEIQDWRERSDRVRWAVQNDTSIRVVDIPGEAGVLKLEGYRLPLAKLVNPNDTPEINAVHHAKLVFWALHRAFSIPDSEQLDSARAKESEAEFTRYFGPMPDADLRRITREDVPQFNKIPFI